MAIVSNLKNKLDQIIYPKTLVKAVYNEDNKRLDNLLDDKVDKINGKGLSTHDYTLAEKNKVRELENYDDTNVLSQISDLQTSKAEKTEILFFKGVSTYENGIISINTNTNGETSYTLSFVTPSAYNPSDLYKINGVMVTLLGSNNQPIKNGWASQSAIILSVVGDKAFLNTGEQSADIIGDMLKISYATQSDTKVDTALNAEALGGKPSNSFILTTEELNIASINPINADTLGGFFPSHFGTSASITELQNSKAPVNSPIFNNPSVSESTTYKTPQLRNIIISNTEPTPTDGKNGDIWLVYEE